MTSRARTLFSRSVFTLVAFSTAAGAQPIPEGAGLRVAAEAALLAGRPERAEALARQCLTYPAVLEIQTSCALTHRMALAALRPSPWRPRTGPLALAAVGAVGLVMTGVYAALAQDALAGCATAGDRAQCPTPGALALATRFGDYTATNVTLGVSLGALGAATAWWLTDALRARATAPALAFALAPTPAGGVVMVGGRF